MALLYDSELALGASAERQRRVVGKIYSLGTLSGALSGAVCSLILLFVEVIWVQVIVGWMPFVVALGLVEAPRQSLDREASHGREMKRMRYLWSHSLLLRQVFVTACFDHILCGLVATGSLAAATDSPCIYLVGFGADSHY